MKQSLKLKTIKTKNNKTYYYAFSEWTNQWQRIKKTWFDDWGLNYFGYLNNKKEVVSETEKETVYLVTPKKPIFYKEL